MNVAKNFTLYGLYAQNIVMGKEREKVFGQYLACLSVFYLVCLSGFDSKTQKHLLPHVYEL